MYRDNYDEGFTNLTYIQAFIAFNFFILDVETVTMEFVVNIKQGHSSISRKHYEKCVHGKVDQQSLSESRFHEKTYKSIETYTNKNCSSDFLDFNHK